MKVKIKGKKYYLPEGWHDVKFCDGIKIIEESLDEVHIFSLFTGLPTKDVRSLNSKEEVYYFMKGFPFLKELPEGVDIPLSVKYKGKRIHLDIIEDENDLGDTSVGQIEDMKALLAELVRSFQGEEESTEEAAQKITKLDLMKLFPKVVSIYLQPFIQGEYDYKKSIKLSKELEKELSFKDISYIGNFFLMRLTDSIDGLKTELHHQVWIVRKLKLAYLRLIKTLDSMQH